MIIVISPEEVAANETEIVNHLFEEGLELFHVRKPFISDREMTDFLNQINESFRSKLVVHSHFELASQYGISRLHFREVDRINKLHEMYIRENTISTSLHDINVFNALKQEWEYAFLSPFFPSISKQGYGQETTILKDSQQRTHSNVKLIALGGIHEKNILEAFNAGVDGVALLGAVWQSKQPLDVFRQCQRKIMEYNYQNR